MYRWQPIVIAALLPLVVTPLLRAQSGGASPFEQAFLRAFPNRADAPATPQLSFKLVNEIELPGPLPGPGPQLLGDRIAIRVSDSVALTPWTPGSSPQLDARVGADLPDDEASEWVIGPMGKHRYRTLPAGRLVAEKRCNRCDRGWRKDWKLRIGGSTLAPPLVTSKRIFVGAMDNRIYCLKRRNGHRVWTADAESRLARRLVLWREDAASDDGEPLELVLAVPDDRAGIQAWNGADGEKVATFNLAKDDGKLVGVPLMTPDGKIVVARQWYTPAEASLMVLQLSPPVVPGDEKPASDPGQAAAPPGAR